MDKIRPELNPEQRKIFLIENAYEKKNQEYNRELSSEEIEKERHSYADEAIEIESKKEELKGIKKDFDKEIKELEAIADERLERIKTRQIKISGTLYGMRNFTTNKMEYYDVYGDMISSRALTPDESQGDLFRTEEGAPEPPEPRGLPAPEETKEKPKGKGKSKTILNEEDVQDAEFEEVKPEGDKPDDEPTDEKPKGKTTRKRSNKNDKPKDTPES